MVEEEYRIEGSHGWRLHVTIRPIVTSGEALRNISPINYLIDCTYVDVVMNLFKT